MNQVHHKNGEAENASNLLSQPHLQLGNNHMTWVHQTDVLSPESEQELVMGKRRPRGTLSEEVGGCGSGHTWGAARVVSAEGS